MQKLSSLLILIILQCLGVFGDDFKINLNIDAKVDLNKLSDAIFEKTEGLIKFAFKRSDELTDISPFGEGDRWVSYMDHHNYHMISAYYHPTKRHYARATGKTDPGRSYAPPGKWAIAIVPICYCGPFHTLSCGNKSNRGVDDDANSASVANISNDINNTNNELNNYDYEETTYAIEYECVYNNTDNNNIPDNNLNTNNTSDAKNLKLLSVHNLLGSLMLLITWWIL